MSYLQWSITGGPCALHPLPAPQRGPIPPASFDPACAATFLRAFGPPTYLVDPGSEASNATHAPAPVDYAQGGLWHVRVAPAVQEGLAGLDVGSREGRREGAGVAEGARVGPGREEWVGQHKPFEFGNERRKDPELV